MIDLEKERRILLEYMNNNISSAIKNLINKSKISPRKNEMKILTILTGSKDAK